MEVILTLRAEDWWGYQAYVEKTFSKQQKTWMNSFWGQMVFGIVVGAFAVAFFTQLSRFHWPTAVVVTLLFVFFLSVFFSSMFRLRRAFEPLEAGTFCGEHKFTFSEEGIASEGRGYSSCHSWEIVKRIERTPDSILIFLDKAYAFVFPEAKLDNPDEFHRYIVEQYSKATGLASA